MKNLYLILAASMVAGTMSATVDYSEKYSAMKHKVPAMLEMPAEDVVEIYDEFNANPAPVVPGKLKAAPAEGEAYYYRPHGSFYIGYNYSTASAYYVPYLYVPNFRDVTYPSAVEGGVWTYQYYDRTVSGRPWHTQEGGDLTFNLITETDTVPTITANGSEYYLYGFNKDGNMSPVTMYAHADLPSRLTAGYLASPSFWGYRDRDNLGSSYNVTGAKDADGGTSAYWFGKNYTGWNGCAIYCEKPQNPYVLRGAAIRYLKLFNSEPVELTMRIYKAGVHEATALSFGDLIATATATLPESTEEANGGLYFTFVEEIPELGLISEVNPVIDDAIYVVLTGYDAPSIGKFGLSLSRDVWDEGIGETGYNLMFDEEGNLTQARGLTSMFNGFKGYSTPSIFLDVTYPFLINNYTNDGSIRKYDANGNLVDDGTTSLAYGSQFSAYTTNPSEEWDITLADGSEVPDWLTLTPEDQLDEDSGEFDGEVIVGIEVAPLPEGVTGRKAVVRFSIPGHHHDLTIIEGEEPSAVAGDVNGDGVLSAADVTALYNFLLNGDDSQLVNGDQNGDGQITAADVTAVYTLLLGAE